jgi:hypothetical protein
MSQLLVLGANQFFQLLNLILQSRNLRLTLQQQLPLTVTQSRRSPPTTQHSIQRKSITPSIILILPSHIITILNHRALIRNHRIALESPRERPIPIHPSRRSPKRTTTRRERTTRRPTRRITPTHARGRPPLLRAPRARGHIRGRACSKLPAGKVREAALQLTEDIGREVPESLVV